MKKIGCVVLAAALLAAGCCGAWAEGLAAPETASITVQGTAQVTAEPDMVIVTAGASVTAGSVGAAQEEMNGIIENVTKKLLELGVLDEDLVTSAYSCYPRYNYETSTVIGYEASHTLDITCRDVEMLDSVIGALTDSGVSQIHHVSYDVSNRSELYQQALDLAIARAEQKALRMAMTSGLTLTGLFSLAENGGYNEGFAVNQAADMAMMKSAAGSAGIRSGSISVTAGVTAVYRAQ